MPMPRFEWAKARSVGEAAGAAMTTVADAMFDGHRSDAGRPADVLKAGGVDLLDLMKEGLLTPRRLINLRGVAGLDVISDNGGGGLRVGTMATLDQVATHSLVRQRYATLADAAAGSASPQIRSVATLGGNILQRPRCWYFRSDDQRCLRRGGGRCFAIHGENQYHAIFANEVCAVDPVSRPLRRLPCDVRRLPSPIRRIRI